MQGTDSNTGIVFGTDTVQVATGGSTRATVNSSGNLGIGTSSPNHKLTLATTSTDTFDAFNISSGNTNSTGYQIGVDSSGNVFHWNTTNSVINFATNNAQQMRLDSGGRLLVGTTGSDQDALLTVARTGDGGTTPSSISTATVATFRATGGLSHEAHVSILGGSTGASKLNFGDRDDEDVGSIRYNHSSNFLEFATNTTTRGRFTNNGRFDVFANSSTDAMFVSSGASAGTAIELFRGMHSASAIAGGTTSLRIYTNGDIQNTNNNYDQISDVKLKENIVDANSQWDDIKAVQIRNYNFKEETGHQTHTQIGVVAQELETVSPGLVYETPDLETVQVPVLDENGEQVLDENGQAVVITEERDAGTVTKAVHTSVLYMKAVKALQEAQTRIETLETQYADLLARVTALEAA